MTVSATRDRAIAPTLGAARHTRVEWPEMGARRLRVVVSPMFSVHASIFEVVAGWRRGADQRWLARMLERAEGVDLSPFALFASEPRVVMSSLGRLPERPNPTFAEQLETVRATSPAALLADMEHDGTTGVPEYRPWVEDPAGTLARFVESISQWWEQVIAPEWSRMAAVLETEVMRIARVLATEGVEPLLASLHPRLRWHDGMLEWPAAPLQVDRTPLGDRELVLAPMACGPDAIMTNPTLPDCVLVAYGAPGAGSLFAPAESKADDALAAMLGAGRAGVLRAASGAHSMRALGIRVGLAPSTVCEHLQALCAMDLVHRGRLGRRVMYARTQRGDRLVELF